VFTLHELGQPRPSTYEGRRPDGYSSAVIAVARLEKTTAEEPQGWNKLIQRHPSACSSETTFPKTVNTPVSAPSRAKSSAAA